MSIEVAQSLTSRIASLEDIIRAQESTLSALLNRLRDVEQFVGGEARAREQSHQQLTQLLGDRAGAAQVADKLGLLIQNLHDRTSALQADAQGTKAALEGVDRKYDAAVRALEQRMQADAAALQDRVRAGEAATADSLRALQASVQGISGAVQQVDHNARDAVRGVQQQVAAEVGALRQRADVLDSSVRGALQDVHGSLSADVAAAAARAEEQLRSAVQSQNASVQALDERVRGELLALGQRQQTETAEVRQHLDDGVAALRASLQSAHSALSAEVASVAQHSQAVDAQHKASHQMMLQELARHDQHLEAVDNAWRSSVTELRGLTAEETAQAKQQARAADEALREGLASAEARLGAADERLAKDLAALTRSVEDRCIAPMVQANVVLARHGERIVALQSDSDGVREYVRTFAQEVDRNANHFRAVMEAAMRASHSDLSDKISVLSAAAAAVRVDPGELRARVDEALTRVWGDARARFVHQSDLGEVAHRLAKLESAVSVEVATLASEDTGLHRRIDELLVAQQRLRSDVSAASDAMAARAAVSVALPAAAAADLSTGVSLADVERFSQLLQNAKEVAADVVDGVRAAEAAQGEAVRAAGEARQLLQEALAARESARQAGERSGSRCGSGSGTSMATHVAVGMAVPVAAVTPREAPHHIPCVRRDSHEISETTGSDDSSDVVTHEEIERFSRLLQNAKEVAADVVDGVRAAEAAQGEAVRAAGEARQLLQEALAARESARQAGERSGSRGGSGSGASMGAPAAGGVALPAAAAADSSTGVSLADVERFSQLLQNAKEVAADVVDGVRAAEAAQGEAVRAAGEARQLLQEALAARESARRAGERSDAEAGSRSGTSGGGDGADTRTPRAGSAGKPPLSPDPAVRPLNARAVVPVTAVRDVYMVQMPLESAAAAGSGPGAVAARPSSTTVRTIPLQQDLSAPADSPTYFVDLSGHGGLRADEPSVGGSEGGSSGGGGEVENSPSHLRLASAGRRARTASTTEILMPTHLFVRKKEYANFKDFTKQEVDAIWVELLGLKRAQGMSREEVHLIVHQMRQSVLSEVVRSLARHEGEVIAVLQAIRSQVNEMKQTPPLYMTDVSVLHVPRALDEHGDVRPAAGAVLQTGAQLLPAWESRPKALPALPALPSASASPPSSARSSEAMPVQVVRSDVRRVAQPPTLTGRALSADAVAPPPPIVYASERSGSGEDHATAPATSEEVRPHVASPATSPRPAREVPDFVRNSQRLPLSPRVVEESDAAPVRDRAASRPVSSLTARDGSPTGEPPSCAPVEGAGVAGASLAGPVERASSATVEPTVEEGARVGSAERPPGPHPYLRPPSSALLAASRTAGAEHPYRTTRELAAEYATLARQWVSLPMGGGVGDSAPPPPLAEPGKPTVGRGRMESAPALPRSRGPEGGSAALRERTQPYRSTPSSAAPGGRPNVVGQSFHLQPMPAGATGGATPLSAPPAARSGWPRAAEAERLSAASAPALPARLPSPTGAPPHSSDQARRVHSPPSLRQRPASGSRRGMRAIPVDSPSLSCTSGTLSTNSSSHDNDSEGSGRSGSDGTSSRTSCSHEETSTSTDSTPSEASQTHRGRSGKRQGRSPKPSSRRRKGSRRSGDRAGSRQRSGSPSRRRPGPRAAHRERNESGSARGSPASRRSSPAGAHQDGSGGRGTRYGPGDTGVLAPTAVSPTTAPGTAATAIRVLPGPLELVRVGGNYGAPASVGEGAGVAAGSLPTLSKREPVQVRVEEGVGKAEGRAHPYNESGRPSPLGAPTHDSGGGVTDSGVIRFHPYQQL